MKNALAKKPSSLSKVLGGCAAVALTLTSLAGGAQAVAADDSGRDGETRLSVTAEDLESVDPGEPGSTEQAPSEMLTSDGGGGAV